MIAGRRIELYPTTLDTLSSLRVEYTLKCLDITHHPVSLSVADACAFVGTNVYALFTIANLALFVIIHVSDMVSPML